MLQMGFSKSDLPNFWKERLEAFGAEIEVTYSDGLKFEKYTLSNGRINVFVSPMEEDNGN